MKPMRFLLALLIAVEVFWPPAKAQHHCDGARPSAVILLGMETRRMTHKNKLSKLTLRTNGRTEAKLKVNVHEGHSPKHLPQ